VASLLSQDPSQPCGYRDMWSLPSQEGACQLKPRCDYVSRQPSMGENDMCPSGAHAYENRTVSLRSKKVTIGGLGSWNF
jgi:hypothetical protein